LKFFLSSETELLKLGFTFVRKKELEFFIIFNTYKKFS